MMINTNDPCFSYKIKHGLFAFQRANADIREPSTFQTRNIYHQKYGSLQTIRVQSKKADGKEPPVFQNKNVVSHKKRGSMATIRISKQMGRNHLRFIKNADLQMVPTFQKDQTRIISHGLHFSYKSQRFKTGVTLA